MSDRASFPVTIRIYSRKETGENWIIRDQKWFDEEEETQIADFSSRLDVALASDLDYQTLSTESRLEMRNRPIESFRKTFAELRDKHAKAWDQAKEYNLVLIKPTHDEFVKAKEKAKRINDTTRVVTYDNEVIMEAILPGHVEDEDGNKFKIETSTIEPLVEEVKILLWRSIRTVDSRLPF